MISEGGGGRTVILGVGQKAGISVGVGHMREDAEKTVGVVEVHWREPEAHPDSSTVIVEREFLTNAGCTAGTPEICTYIHTLVSLAA